MPAAPGVRPPLPLAASWVRLRAAAPARPDWGAPQRPQGGAAEPGRALEAVAAVRPGPSLLRRPHPVLGPRSEPGVCFQRPRPGRSHLLLSVRRLVCSFLPNCGPLVLGGGGGGSAGCFVLASAAGLRVPLPRLCAPHGALPLAPGLGPEPYGPSRKCGDVRSGSGE